MKLKLLFILFGSFTILFANAQMLKLDIHYFHATVYLESNEFDYNVRTFGRYLTGLKGNMVSKYDDQSTGERVVTMVATLPYIEPYEMAITYLKDNHFVDESTIKNIESTKEWDTTNYTLRLQYLLNDERIIKSQMDTTEYGSEKHRELYNSVNRVIGDIARHKDKLNDYENLKSEQFKIHIVFKQSRFSSKGEPDALKPHKSPEHTWDDFFVPGLSYSYLQPSISSGFGFYQGVKVELIAYARFKTKTSGPSYLKNYISLINYRSSVDNTERLFLYSAGLISSLENNIKRRVAIPYIGIDVGGLSSQRIGTSLVFIPKIGMFPYITKRFQVFAQAGYFYAIRNTNQFESWAFDAGFNLILWK